MHMNKYFPFSGELYVASWNVEGLSDIKVWELIGMMRRLGIGILCIQETRISKSPYYFTDDGYLVVLSGSSSDEKEWAGVGFIISPFMVSSVCGFLQQSNRLGCLKLRVPGGKIGIISAYAPHGGYPFNSRQLFFDDLGRMFSRTSVNGLKLVFGDLNSRILKQVPGEELYFGEHVFGDASSLLKLGTNRELLLELCSSLDLAVANTFFDNSVEESVTFRSVGASPTDIVDTRNFAQLDLLLIPHGCMHNVIDIRSNRKEALASHHYLVTARIAVNLATDFGSQASHKLVAKRFDRMALKDRSISSAFVELFKEALASKSSERDSGNLNCLSECVAAAFAAAESALPEVHTSKRKPWISQSTLDLIEQRRLARTVNDFVEEAKLHKLVKKSAKSDRKKWLEDLAGSNTWANLRKLRGGPKHLQGRLCNQH